MIMKYLYRIIILCVIFGLSVMYFGKNIKQQTFHLNNTVKMEKATFPNLTIKTGEEVYNLLHGYSGNIDAAVMRKSVISVDVNRSFEVHIQEQETDVKKLVYEVRTSTGAEVLDSGSISALTNTDTEKIAKIKIKSDLEPGQEYTLKLTVTTNVSKKINYYTRIKYIEDAKLSEKLKFVKYFHEATFDKAKGQELQQYLEADATADISSLSKVTIKSPVDLITWGKLSPKIISESVPTFNEINEETAAIELAYVVSADTGNGEQAYRVKEFFRIRFTPEKTYLLYYERSMEALFDMDSLEYTENGFKIGITNDSALEMDSSSDNSKLCFVRNGDLWYYNLKEDKVVSVFSFKEDNEEETDYIRDEYDQHDIQILGMDEEGNIDFTVYGYMNRGDYEGRVAIVLYHYYAAQKRIEEQVYIPMNIPYQLLKEEMNSFSYVSGKDVFYFSMNNVIYAYDIITKSLEIIVSGITSENFLMSKEGSYIAWQNSKDAKEATSITILNLETEDRKTISTTQGDSIIILGKTGKNFVYGYAVSKDITVTTDGSIVVPMYKLDIANVNGAVLKTYQKEGSYVTGIVVKDNVIELTCVKKGSSGYEPADQDYILNNVEEKQDGFGFKTDSSDKALKELYLTIPQGFTIKKQPTISNTLNTIITEDTTLHLEEKESTETKYYVYAVGDILASYNNAGKAVLLADEKMGVVVDSNHQIIWERGGKAVTSSIYGISETSGGSGKASINICINLLLKYNSLSVSTEELSNQKGSIFEKLKNNLKWPPVNLTGCTLDEVLYYVSERRPIIAMKDASNAVLITAYDEFNVTMLDPNQGKAVKMGLNSAAVMFEAAGNVFISYGE